MDVLQHILEREFLDGSKIVGHVWGDEPKITRDIIDFLKNDCSETNDSIEEKG